MRGATIADAMTGSEIVFQSTRPMRGATETSGLIFVPLNVSIHAPHAGRDECAVIVFVNSIGFNPRAPCGARLILLIDLCQSFWFQSTRPMRGATAKEVTTSLFCHIFMGITRHKYDFLDV